MIAQIAAHRSTSKVPVVLFDLPAKGKARRTASSPRRSTTSSSSPAPLGVADDATVISHCRAHGLEARPGLKIAPFGTADHRGVQHLGLSITKLSRALPDAIRSRVLRHPLLQPPRYMPLVELMQHPTTDAGVIDQLKPLSPPRPGQGRGARKDTPNFIANRVGIAGMLSTMKEVERYGLTYDVVDDLTGKSWAAPAAAPSAPPTWWAWTPWPTSSRRCRTTLGLKPTRSTAASARPPCRPPCWTLGTWARRPRPDSSRRPGATSCVSSWTSEQYVPAGQKTDEGTPACSKSLPVNA